MKNILIVCPCSYRGNSIGLIAEMLIQFEKSKENGCTFDLFDTNYFQKHYRDKYDVREYFTSFRNGIVDRLIKKLPKIRSKYSEYLIIKDFKKIISNTHYDFILFYKVPSFSDTLIEEAHRVGAKTVLYPWGSEVLRASSETDKHLFAAYSKTDYVVGFEKSNLNKKATQIYKVPKSNIFELKTVFRTIKVIKDIPNNWDRTKLSEVVGIPLSSYNIVCGYSGCETQRHIEMIEALAENLEKLPKEYQLVFPVTYVAQPAYIQRLRVLCEEKGLNASFLTTYMTNQQIACLHLISDLFLNLQPTDAGNLFMIEALYCKNQIITGKWLNYDQFEDYGLPYYAIDKLEDLPSFLSDYFEGRIVKVKVPELLIKKYDYPDGYDPGSQWLQLFGAAD